MVPSYYRILIDTQSCTNDHTKIRELKLELRSSLDEKYFTSILQLHWIATYLDPSFKSFSFVGDRSYVEEQKKEIPERSSYPRI